VLRMFGSAAPSHPVETTMSTSRDTESCMMAKRGGTAC